MLAIDPNKGQLCPFARLGKNDRRQAEQHRAHHRRSTQQQVMAIETISRGMSLANLFMGAT
jgi:hypothetical protein